MKKKNKSSCQIHITSVYRSGSEYLSSLINLHPNISSTMYRINFMRYIYKKYTLKDKKINYKKIILDLSKRLKKRYKTNLNVLKYENIIKDKNYGKIYDLIMTEMYLKNKKNIWAEKNQLQWREIEVFIKIMTNGKAIHILRDPRSVMLSYKKFTYHRKPAYLSAAFNSVDAMHYISSHIKKYKKSFLFIKYEDLLNNKEHTLNKIWKFLNVKKLKYSDIDKYKNKNIKNWKSNTTQTEKKFDNNFAINGWKKELTNDEILYVETICHKYMKKFGYSVSQFKSRVNHKKIKDMLKNNKKLKIMYNTWYKNNYNFGVQSYPANPTKEQNWGNNT